MMTLVTFTSIFITRILAVVISITNPVLVNALAVGASELVTSAGVIVAIALIAVIFTVVVVVTDVGAKDTLSTATLKFFLRTLCSAVSFVRGIPAVNFLVTPLTRVIAGSIGTSKLITCWIMAVSLVRAIGAVADMVAPVFARNTLTVGARHLLT